MSISRIRLFLLSDLLLAVPAFFVLSLSWLYFNRHSSAGFSGWLSLFVGFLLMSAVSRIYAGGAVNVLMPTYFLMIMLSAAACLHMAGSGGRKFSVIAAVLMLVLNAVHGWQWHALQKLIPSSLDRLAGDALVERIRQVPGRVCASKDGYLAYLAGKEFCAHNALLADVMNGGDKHIAGMLAADARDKIMSGYYEVIILNNPTELTGYGLDRQALPYTATLIDYSFPPLDGKQFFPVSGGPRPGSWLQYNGDKWVDERPVLPPVE